MQGCETLPSLPKAIDAGTHSLYCEFVNMTLNLLLSSALLPYPAVGL